MEIALRGSGGEVVSRVRIMCSLFGLGGLSESRGPERGTSEIRSQSVEDVSKPRRVVGGVGVEENS